MKLLVWIAVPVLAWLGLSYLRIAVKRLQLFLSIRTLCKRKGWTLFGTHRLWMFSPNGYQSCDFHLFTGAHLYCVKLFSVRYRRSVLCLCEGHRYYIRQFLGLVGMAASARIPIDGKQRTMPQYNFRYRLKPEWDTAQVHNILLLSPVCMEVNTHGADRKKVIVAGMGDRYYDMQLYSRPRFLSRVELDNEKQTIFKNFDI